MTKKLSLLLCSFICLSLQAANPAPQNHPTPQTRSVPLPKPRPSDVNRLSPNSNPNDLFDITTDGKGKITARSKEYFKTDEDYVVSGGSVLIDNNVYKNGDVIHKGATIPGNTHFSFPAEN